MAQVVLPWLALQSMQVLSRGDNLFPDTINSWTISAIHFEHLVSGLFRLVGIYKHVLYIAATVASSRLVSRGGTEGEAGGAIAPPLFHMQDIAPPLIIYTTPISKKQTLLSSGIYSYKLYNVLLLLDIRQQEEIKSCEY